MRFQINSPKVIHQIFESEVVVVNLETGVYYSLRASGVDIWRGLVAGLSDAEITSKFDSPKAKTAIRQYLQQLGSEHLIVEIVDESHAVHTDKVKIDHPFADPVLEKFTDMREMLLIDPIHELDESGWPRRPSPEQR